MQLKLTFQKDVKPLINYLSDFKKVSDSLLLEFDVENRRFAAKGLSGNKGEVEAFRFSYLPFDACGADILVNQKPVGPTDQCNLHVFHGFLNHLHKFIQVLNMGQDFVNSYGMDNGNIIKPMSITMEFADDIGYGLLGDEMPDGSMAQHKFEIMRSMSILTEAPRLHATVKSFKMEQFKMLTNDEFRDVIFFIFPDERLEFKIDNSILGQIATSSEIYKSIANKGKDFIVFNIRDGKITASGQTFAEKGYEESCDITIEEGLNTKSYDGVSIRVQKEWFNKMVTKGNAPWTAYIGQSALYDVDRLCLETTDPETGKVTQVTLARTMDE